MKHTSPVDGKKHSLFTPEEKLRETFRRFWGLKRLGNFSKHLETIIQAPEFVSKVELHEAFKTFFSALTAWAGRQAGGYYYWGEIFNKQVTTVIEFSDADRLTVKFEWVDVYCSTVHLKTELTFCATADKAWYSYSVNGASTPPVCKAAGEVFTEADVAGLPVLLLTPEQQEESSTW